MKRLLLVGMICWWVIGCGGGGGGEGDSSGGMPTEAELARAFKDEAIRIAVVNAVVMCDMIVCSIADRETETELEDGVVGHACFWRCLESTIDDSGETRNYMINLNWQRLPDGCFESEMIAFALESPVLCVPNQERF